MSTLHISVTPTQLARRRPSKPALRVKASRPARPSMGRRTPRDEIVRPTLADPGKMGLMTTVAVLDRDGTQRQEMRIEEVRMEPISAARVRQLEVEAPWSVEPDLEPVDLLFKAWAVTPAGESGELGGFPALAQLQWECASTAVRPARIDDHQADLITRAVRESPAWAGGFVRIHWRSGLPIPAQMEKLGLKRRKSLYDHRRTVLGFFRGVLPLMGVRLPRIGMC